MGETFDSLLRLDWSFLDRGRDARQSTVSARPALVVQSKAAAQPDNRHDRRARTAFMLLNRPDPPRNSTKDPSRPEEPEPAGVGWTDRAQAGARRAPARRRKEGEC